MGIKPEKVAPFVESGNAEKKTCPDHLKLVPDFNETQRCECPSPKIRGRVKGVFSASYLEHYFVERAISDAILFGYDEKVAKARALSMIYNGKFTKDKA